MAALSAAATVVEEVLVVVLVVPVDGHAKQADQRADVPGFVFRFALL